MFSAFFIERPKFALVISIVLTLVGALSIYLLPITEYPSISPPSIQVNGVYPGASAEVVEATVGTPIEDAVNGVEEGERVIVRGLQQVRPGMQVNVRELPAPAEQG